MTHPEVPQATARTSVGGPSMKGWNEAAEAMADAIDAWQVETHWWGDSLPSASIAEAVLTALLEAKQSEPCTTCGGSGTDSCGISDAPCDICNGSGRAPGAPLVLLAPEQVACMRDIDGELDLRQGWIDSPTPWTPLYAAQTEEEQT